MYLVSCCWCFKVIRYKLRATCLATTGECRTEEGEFIIPYPETNACLRGRMFDTLPTDIISIELTSIEEEMIDD